MSVSSYDDTDEKAKDKEMEVAAKLELEEWYVKYRERIANIKEQNRKNAALEPDAENNEAGDSLEWDKVVSLCGFKSPKSVKDTSRMRSILLKLKECKV